MSLAGYSLLQPLRQRRSRRFGPGMRREGNCLADENHPDPLPLSEEEEAHPALAACGITPQWRRRLRRPTTPTGAVRK